MSRNGVHFYNAVTYSGIWVGIDTEPDLVYAVSPPVTPPPGDENEDTGLLSNEELAS